jgi:PAS domain S-box-containing protein
MGMQNEPSIESLQASLALNRKLISLIQKPGSEAEVARVVVDMLYEEFPKYRVSYATVRPDASFRIVYSRQPLGMKELTGLAAQLPDCEYVRKINNFQINAISDIRTDKSTRLIADVMVAKLGTVARLDFPFEKLENGDIGLLSLTHVEPVEWSQGTIQLLQEIGELVHLIFREARTRERLRKSEQIFEQITSNLPLVFWMVDVVDTFPNQTVTYVSPAYEEVWGLSTESVMKDPYTFLQAIHPEDRDRIVAGVVKGRSGPYEQFYRVVKPDGSIRWIKDRGHPLFNESGEMYRILGIAEDITALHLAEAKLESTRAQVISNAKLAALGEMAGGIAHEISNPLAVISALVHHLKETRVSGLSPDKVDENIDTIEKMSNSIAGIVKSLRMYSRQSDRDPLSRAELGEILGETLLLCETKVQNTSAELSVEIPDTAIFLNCRASEISQVILNLVNNALDAVSTAREKVITVKARVQAESILLSVEDSGPGVGENIREKIFQPFFTTKEVGKGTGLGLSISKGIVEALGGKLYLDGSCPRTKFVVELPLGV